MPYSIINTDASGHLKFLKLNNGASPSGKAAGFGPAIPEVRILPPQKNKKVCCIADLFIERIFQTACAFWENFYITRTWFLFLQRYSE